MVRYFVVVTKQYWSVRMSIYCNCLFRYIHRNPIETTIPLVELLEDYAWSSYPAFIGLEKSPEWLERELTYQRLKHLAPFSGYRNYVWQGVDEDTKDFHEKGKMGAIFGDETFKQWVYDELLPSSRQKGRAV
jgi:putative transposase